MLWLISSSSNPRVENATKKILPLLKMGDAFVLIDQSSRSPTDSRRDQPNSDRAIRFLGCALLLLAVDKWAMDAKRTFTLLIVFLAPLSFLVAQDKNAKGGSSVQVELEAIKTELKAQQDKIDQLSQEIAKLSEAIKESEANREKAASDKASSSSPPPKAVAVSPSPTPPATAGVENASPAEPGGTRSHVVAKGETLTQIAKQYGVTVEEIEQANKIQDAKKLQIGQTIKIPGSASPSPSP
jgi:LysM domain.